MSMQGYDTHHANSYDAPDGLTNAFTYLERAESMDLVNDPRFFNSNVIEKRLAAFKGLNVIASFVLSGCIGQMYSLNKGFVLVTFIGIFQLCSFTIMCTTAFLLIISIFVQTNQMFYIHRLLTAGPTGLEQASLFYLNKTMTKWRHFSMRSLFSGLILFMVGTGAILSVKFIKDAQKALDDATGKSSAASIEMGYHYAIAFVVFCLFCACAGLLAYIWNVHRNCFRTHHDFAYSLQSQLTLPMRMMQSRAGTEHERLMGMSEMQSPRALSSRSAGEGLP